MIKYITIFVWSYYHLNDKVCKVTCMTLVSPQWLSIYMTLVSPPH